MCRDSSTTLYVELSKILFFILISTYRFLQILSNNLLVQWDPTSLDKVDDEKLDLIFKPFDKELELQIPESEESRLVVV